MRWSILNNSANILSFLRERGFAIPPQLTEQYPHAIRDYFFAEHPLCLVPKFEAVDLEEQELDGDSLSLEEYEEPVSVVDARPSVELLPAYSLQWSGAQLTCFPRFFLEGPNFPLRFIMHINLSHNRLEEVPVEFFRLPSLESLDLSHNLLKALPGVELWSSRVKLQVLVASHNHIGSDSSSPVIQRKHGGVRLPFQDLWYLDLSHNELASFPFWAFNFHNLRHLDLKHNTKVRSEVGCPVVVLLCGICCPLHRP